MRLGIRFLGFLQAPSLETQSLATLHQDLHLEFAHGGNDAGEEWNADH